MTDPAPTSHSVSPDLITTITQHDVLMGRGSGPNEFMGNQRFRSIVEAHKEEYKSASKNIAKKKIAQEVIDKIHAQGGRFLKQVETEIPVESFIEEAVWRKVEEKVALEKCQQALRQKEKPVGTSESRNASTASSEGGVGIAVHPESFEQGFEFAHPTYFPPNLTIVLPRMLAGPPSGYAPQMFFLQQQATSAQPMAANPFLSNQFNFCVENAASRSQGQEQCGLVNYSAMRYLVYSGLSPAWTDSVSSHLAQSSRSVSAEKKVVASACPIPTTTQFMSEIGASAATALQEDIYSGDAVFDEMLDQMDSSFATSNSGPPLSELAVSGGAQQDDMVELFLEQGS